LPGLADGGDRFTIGGLANGSSLDLDLRDAAQGRPHYRATAHTTDPSPPRRWIAPVALEPHEHPYTGTTLFHGPKLQALRGAPGVGREGADCIVGTSPSPGWVDVAAVDAALQLALLWARRAGTGDTLPMSVDEVRLHGRGALGDPARCVVLAVSADDTNAVCDAALLDPDGVPRVELIGIHLVRRPGA